MKQFIISLMIVLGCSSCSDFLDTYPHDALSPVNAWKTESDVEKFLIGCYDGWASPDDIFYWDTTSDIGFANFARDSWRNMSNGSMTAANVYSLYDFFVIRSCNTLLENIKSVPFEDEKRKDNIIGQAKTIRAYQYFLKNWWYGGVPIIENYETSEEAKVMRNSEDEVKKYIYEELDEAIPMLYDVPEEKGRIAKGAALALKMRSALYYEDYQRARDAARGIMDLNLYELDPDYNNLFLVEGQDSKEIIVALQFIEETKSLFHIGMCLYNNNEGGWSGCVPLQDLVEYYEMTDGLTQEESPLYDPEHPYANRDPRMGMTILYPGRDWDGWIFNTLDMECMNKDGEIVKNGNHPVSSDNSSDSGLSWAKYLGTGKNYYKDKFATNACPILFRYAEVLLSFAEAENELEGPTDSVYWALNEVRNRVGMPDVDEVRYATKEQLKELIQRERCVEFAGEGLRRADIVRWKDANGKMLAETLLNKQITRVVGTVDYSEQDPGKRAKVTGTVVLDNREFKPYHRYLPLPLSAMDTNPKLKQNPGY